MSDIFQFMAGFIKKKMTSALTKLENDKKSYPGLSDELDKKISALKKRMTIFEDPQGIQGNPRGIPWNPKGIIRNTRQSLRNLKGIPKEWGRLGNH